MEKQILFRGTYSCLHRYFGGVYERIKVPCDVLAESDKTYQIKLLAPNVNGHRYGDVIRVQKRMVSGAPRTPSVDCSEAWWHE